MYGPKWPFLLRYGSRDTRRIDFPRVDWLSTDTPVLGCHMCAMSRAPCPQCAATRIVASYVVSWHFPSRVTPVSRKNPAAKPRACHDTPIRIAT